jgi:hypothetical protein
LPDGLLAVAGGGQSAPFPVDESGLDGYHGIDNQVPRPPSY